MFNDIITGAIVAQGEAAIAVALRTQNKKKTCNVYFFNYSCIFRYY